MTDQATSIPRPGMFATVRKRRAVISAVVPYGGEAGQLHLVSLEYKDDQSPEHEQLIWELEPNRTVLEPTALPQAGSSDPMPPEDFDALVRATRWSAARPYLDPDHDGPLGRMPISSPFHGAFQIEDFQLVPLLKALRMPRVNLLIADDVGIGKTIEAGLILSELLLRRRIQRVLILTPAALRTQWRDELSDKFALPFDLVDQASTVALRKRLGLDANPWRAFSRIIASYHYLRQEDVLEQFRAACRTPEGSPHLPWDLLIVDECHNLMPSVFGEDSDLCTMLRQIAPFFEHRLFLSATPHNGHTRSFTGLLEILDPVRFSQTDELKPAEKERIQQIAIRRLKREINERTNPPRFCTRLPPRALLLGLDRRELALSAAFGEFRAKVRSVIGGGERGRRRAGRFAVEILGKRLLSCPTAFAESWRRCREALADAPAATESDVAAVEREVRKETGDDREAQARESTAAGVVGAWLRNAAAELQAEIAGIDRALAELGFGGNDPVALDPRADSRFAELERLVGELLREGAGWRSDERLLVFTEYKTTLDYLVRRLRATLPPADADRILTLFGGMNDDERDLVKQAFNDPADRVRILLATDAAAEGLNLQRTARYLLHFDCPWNPSKLEQRNGRIDRHGQARDVTIHHFVSNEDQDLQFLAYVIGKADGIREDLGSANELFDEASYRRLVDGENLEKVKADLDRQVLAARGRASFDADSTAVPDGEEGAAGREIAALAAELDLGARPMRDTLEAALAIGRGRPQLECTETPATCRLRNPDLPGWVEVVDESLRRPTAGGGRGPVPRLAFSSEPLLEEVGGRKVFAPKPDVQMMHLSHPMLQRAVGSLSRRRFPGAGDAVSRWTVRRGGAPGEADGLVLLTVEELAVNELRETFHHWVRTLEFPLRNGRVELALPPRPASDLGGGAPVSDSQGNAQAKRLLEDAEPELKGILRDHAVRLTREIAGQLEADLATALAGEEERYRSRQGEVSALIAENTLAKLEREVAALQQERRQGLLFEAMEHLDEIDRSIEEKRAEIGRRGFHYEEVRGQLERERQRVLRDLLPRRFALAGEVRVFPVTLEIRLPGAAA